MSKNEHVRMTSHIWLSKTLAPDSEMDGLFFTDRNLYTHLALLYIQSIGLRKPEEDLGGREYVPRPNTDWMQRLSVMLSKSAPSDELAAVLMQRMFQPERVDLDGEEKKDVITAILIYLFVSNYYVYFNHIH